MMYIEDYVSDHVHVVAHDIAQLHTHLHSLVHNKGTACLVFPGIRSQPPTTHAAKVHTRAKVHRVTTHSLPASSSFSA
jgi:hypothetical protein